MVLERSLGVRLCGGIEATIDFMLMSIVLIFIIIYIASHGMRFRNDNRLYF